MDEPSGRRIRTRAPTRKPLSFGADGVCVLTTSDDVYGAFSASISAAPPYTSASIHGAARQSTDSPS